MIGLVCTGVLAELGQHGSHLAHIPQHIPRNVASLLGESFQVHRLEDLACGARSWTWAAGLTDEFILVQDAVAAEDELEGVLGVQHQLLVGHGRHLSLPSSMLRAYVTSMACSTW